MELKTFADYATMKYDIKLLNSKVFFTKKWVIMIKKKNCFLFAFTIDANN